MHRQKYNRKSGVAAVNSLVVELVEVLHVAKDDVLFVDYAWWDLLNTTGHLPQVRLRWDTQC